MRTVVAVRAAVGLATAVVAGLVAAGPAPAYVAPGATIVSASLERLEQGDDSTSSVAISGSGRFVVMKTQARNLFPDAFADPPGQYRQGGIFRRDLLGGRLELVAVGDLRRAGDNEILRRGADSPSISRDGRFVAFSTADQLVPADDNTNVDVYVRDMARGSSDPEAFELVSARDGATAPARYGPRTPDLPFRNPGSEVAAGRAISADGNRVVFRSVEVASDLPARTAVDTPPFQVFVRDRAARTTTLVTQVAASAPPAPAGGALGPAAISADGTTVTWPGREAGAQARFLDGEFPDPSYFFYLWRRIADGPASPTRRITGAADVDDPGCGGGFFASASALGPCFGPLSDTEQSLPGIASTAPALSADGLRVAFVTGSPPRPPTPGFNLDLWVTNMQSGVSRKAGTGEFTREGTAADAQASAPIFNVALSANGRWAAIVTQRTRFLLPVLRLVTPARTVPGLSELYLVDLAGRTIERGVRAYTGSDTNAGVDADVSLSDDGGRVAFTSAADNLFFGDGNGRTDAFVVDRLDAAPPSAEGTDLPEPFVTPPPPAPRPRRLRVTVKRVSTSGLVRLEVRATVTGRLAAVARGRLPDSDGRLRGAVRRLASRSIRVRKRGRVRVDLRLAKRYVRVLKRERSLRARVLVTLTPKRGTRLERELGVRFAYRAPARSKRGSARR